MKKQEIREEEEERRGGKFRTLTHNYGSLLERKEARTCLLKEGRLDLDA